MQFSVAFHSLLRRKNILLLLIVKRRTTTRRSSLRETPRLRRRRPSFREGPARLTLCLMAQSSASGSAH